MISENEKEVIIMNSLKNEVSFKQYKEKMKKLATGIAIIFSILYFILFCLSPDMFVQYIFSNLVTICLIDGIVYFLYWLNKYLYDNIFLIVTNKGLTHINIKTGFKNFIPTNQISSVSCIRETIRIVTNSSNQPLNVSFLKNANELKNALDNLVYNTEKRKDVVILNNTTNPKPNVVTEKSTPIEEVKQFKELLDCGIITQEEFDKKKKELLEL